MIYESEIIYGPVDSRRLGRSLGINLTPLDRKICSFDCIYCSGGRTKLKTLEVKPKETFSLDYVREELEKGFNFHKQNGTKIDYISVVGSTEPTIYPKFSDFANLFKLLVNKSFPGKPTAIFTNSTTLDKEKIKSALQLFDRKFFKLDAGDEKTFQRINRPVENIHLENIVNNLIKMPNIELSIGIIDAPNGNYNSLKNEVFVEIIKSINPKIIYIYDMDRPAPMENGFRMMRTSNDRLVELADYISLNTKKEVNALRAKKSRGIHELARNIYSYQQRHFSPNKDET